MQLPFEKLRQRTERPFAWWKEKERALFAPLASLRPMIVMVDYEILAEADQDEQVAYLLGLAATQWIHRYWFADYGPPPTVPRLKYEWCPAEVVSEWIVVHSASAGSDLAAVYRQPNGEDAISGTHVQLGDYLDIATEEVPPE